jgi:RNA polymerase sigma-70 factor (ECF subfamily)
LDALARTTAPDPPSSISRFGQSWTSAADARFRRVVDEHAPFLAIVLRKAGIPLADVDDEVQRTLTTVARRLHELRPGSEKLFVLRVALNLAKHAHRTAYRRREVLLGEMIELVDPVCTPEWLTNQKTVCDLLDPILGEMNHPQREVFIMYELEERTIVEIASLLGIPPGTVASRLARARNQFRAAVEELALQPTDI